MISNYYNKKNLYILELNFRGWSNGKADIGRELTPNFFVFHILEWVLSCQVTRIWTAITVSLDKEEIIFFEVIFLFILATLAEYCQLFKKLPEFYIISYLCKTLIYCNMMSKP